MRPGTVLQTRLQQSEYTKGPLIYFPLHRINQKAYAEKFDVIFTSNEERIYILLMPKRKAQSEKNALMLCN